jgi:hypothetical protein
MTGRTKTLRWAVLRCRRWLTKDGQLVGYVCFLPETSMDAERVKRRLLRGLGRGGP